MMQVLLLFFYETKVCPIRRVLYNKHYHTPPPLDLTHRRREGEGMKSGQRDAGGH